MSQLTENQKRNARKRNKAEREHELKLAMWNALGRDPSMKYFMGASLGLGSTWLASLMEDASTSKKDKKDKKPADKVVNIYESILGAGSPLLSAAGIFDFNKDGEGGLAGNMFQFGTSSYTGFCMLNCILMSASGNKEDNAISSIIPVI